MQICCTKALLDELDKNIVSQSNTVEIEPLFSWSAHLITLKRRKAVVAVNDSNRFGFMLYGLKSKDFANIREHLSKGIVRCLQDEGVKQDVIERYTESLSEAVFTKTKDRSAVARLNKACEIVKYFEEDLDGDEMYQVKLTKVMNHDLCKVSKQSGFAYPYEQVIKDLEQWHGTAIVQRKAADLLVQLDLGVHKASRRLLVPLPTTFYELHQMLQIAYDWQESHLHCFFIYNGEGKRIAYIVHEDDFDGEQLSDCPTYFDEQLLIEQYLQEDYSIQYCYDFGDDWLHDITLRGYIDHYDKNAATCIMAEGNAPPEDVGGIPGYIEFLKIMSDPDHPEHEDMMYWAESQGYGDFDIQFVNHRLKNLD